MDVSMREPDGAERGAQDEPTWNFVLKFRLQDPAAEPADLLDALYVAGCDDATIGVGRPGSIALDFSRQAPTAEHALRTALDDVRRAIPGAVPTEAAPDMVNLSDLADMVGCTRQNMRKYAAGETRTVRVPFPEPAHSGTPSLWRLAEVLAWLDRNTDLRPDTHAIQLARAVSSLNLEVQRARIDGGSGA